MEKLLKRRGRPLGSKNSRPRYTGFTPHLDGIKPRPKTPLEYMLDVMNDPDADPKRRDRMATGAAPYCHARIADAQVGKKEVQEKAAIATVGAAWSGDLAFEGEAIN